MLIVLYFVKAKLGMDVHIYNQRQLIATLNNNTVRHLTDLEQQCILQYISGMFTPARVDTFSAILRHRTASFVVRLGLSSNGLTQELCARLTFTLMHKNQLDSWQLLDHDSTNSINFYFVFIIIFCVIFKLLVTFKSEKNFFTVYQQRIKSSVKESKANPIAIA